MQVLDRLQTTSPEEGIAIMRQLFNPMRGRHVTVREVDRSGSNKLAPKEQYKVETKS